MADETKKYIKSIKIGTDAKFVKDSEAFHNLVTINGDAIGDLAGTGTSTKGDLVLANTPLTHTGTGNDIDTIWTAAEPK